VFRACTLRTVVLDGDDRLIGEGFQQFDLSLLNARGSVRITKGHRRWLPTQERQRLTLECR
jgi:hypothetical protein